MTLFNKFDVERLNNCIMPTILKQSSCGDLFMFPSDYDLYRKFVRYLFQSDGTVFPNDLYLQGVEYGKMDDCLYMFSNLGVVEAKLSDNFFCLLDKIFIDKNLVFENFFIEDE